MKSTEGTTNHKSYNWRLYENDKCVEALFFLFILIMCCTVRSSSLMRWRQGVVWPLSNSHTVPLSCDTQMWLAGRWRGGAFLRAEPGCPSVIWTLMIALFLSHSDVMHMTHFSPWEQTPLNQYHTLFQRLSFSRNEHFFKKTQKGVVFSLL